MRDFLMSNTDLSVSIDGYSSNRFLDTSLEFNDSNKFDYVGRNHNVMLNAIRSLQDNHIEAVNFSLSALRGIYDGYINSMSIGTSAKNYLLQIPNIIDGKSFNKYSFSALKNNILALESKVQNDNNISVLEQRLLLSTLSIARHSMVDALNGNSSINNHNVHITSDWYDAYYGFFCDAFGYVYASGNGNPDWVCEVIASICSANLWCPTS